MGSYTKSQKIKGNTSCVKVVCQMGFDKVVCQMGFDKVICQMGFDKVVWQRRTTFGKVVCL